MRQVILVLIVAFSSCKSFDLRPEARNVEMFPPDGSLYAFFAKSSRESFGCKFIAVGVSDARASGELEATNDVRNQAAAMNGNLVFGKYGHYYGEGGLRSGVVFRLIAIPGAAAWDPEGPHIYHCKDLKGVLEAQKKQEDLDLKAKVDADRRRAEAAEAQRRATEQEEKQSILARKKGREASGLDLGALESATAQLYLLQQEEEELKIAGQTIKAKKKHVEVEQAKATIINILKVGRVVVATPECPFERAGLQHGIGYGDAEGRRLFRLSCFEGKLKVTFNFQATGESSPWRVGSQTREEMTEIFEGGLRFSGSIEIVDGRDRRAVDFRDGIFGLGLRFYDPYHIVVASKIVGLEPLEAAPK